jgi:hypothetical protein
MTEFAVIFAQVIVERVAVLVAAVVIVLQVTKKEGVAGCQIAAPPLKTFPPSTDILH